MTEHTIRVADLQYGDILKATQRRVLTVCQSTTIPSGYRLVSTVDRFGHAKSWSWRASTTMRILRWPLYRVQDTDVRRSSYNQTHRLTPAQIRTLKGYRYAVTPMEQAR